MPQSDYPPGTIVFAKLKGYPWWPGEVVDDSSVPDRVLRSKPKSKGPNWTVFFYGKTREYGFFAQEVIKPFVVSEAEADLAGKRFKTKELELAVRQALDPSLLDAMDHDRDDRGDVGDDAHDGSPMDDDDELDQTPRKKKKSSIAGLKKALDTKTPTKSPTKSAQRNGKSSLTSATKKKTFDEEDELLEEEEDTVKSENKLQKKRISKDDDDNGRGSGKRRKSTSEYKYDLSATRKAPGSPTKSGDKGPSSVDGGRDETASRTSVDKQKAKKAADDKDPAPDEQHKQLKELRHSLQRVVYNVSQVSPDEYRRIDKTLTDVEKFEMTLSLLQWTKIGKVIKAAHKHEYPDDTYNIKQRVEKLLAAWKELLPEGEHEGRSHGSENGHRSAADERKGEDADNKTAQYKPESDSGETKVEVKAVADVMELDPVSSAETSGKPSADPLPEAVSAPDNVPATELAEEVNSTTKDEPIFNLSVEGPTAKSNAEDVVMSGVDVTNIPQAS